MLHKKYKKKAFTILELLIVVAILAILAIVVMPRFIGSIEKSKDARDLAEINSVWKATQMYYMEYNKYPTIQGSLVGATETQPVFGHPQNIDFSELMGKGYLAQLPHFSYWLIDYKGEVYHAKYKVVTVEGTSLGLNSNYKYMKKDINDTTLSESVSSSVLLASTQYLSINDQKGRRLPEISYGFTGVLEHPEAVGGNPVPLTGVKQLSMGYSHALALMQDGTVLSWGQNKYGQLGYDTNVGTTTVIYTPTPIPGLTGVKCVCAGADFSSAIMADGTVKSWGYNKFEQLGTDIGVGTENAYYTPTTIPGIQGATTLSSGYYQTLAVMNDGTVMGWGHNSYGELGTSPTNTAPITISGITGVKQAEAGVSFSLFLKNDGTVWSSGYNYNRQLGYLTPYQETQPHKIITQIPSLTDIVSIEAGNCDGAAINKDGALITWGHNHDGQLGRTEGVGMDGNCLPGLAGALPAVDQVVMSDSTTIIRTTDGRVVTYGNNYYGRRGDITGGVYDGSYITPAYVKGLSNVQRIAEGGTNVAVTLANGDVMTWGSNMYGLLGSPTGIGTNTKVITPTLLEGLN